MNKNTAKELFDQPKGGTITFPRTVIGHVLEVNHVFDPVSIYSYLLFHANYGDGPNSEGIFLHRGEISIHMPQLMKVTGWKKTPLYELIHYFIQIHLLEPLKEEGPSCYLLPFYEEHCGHNVRKEPLKPTPSPEESLNHKKFIEFFDYYHFLLGFPPSDKESAWKEWQKLSQEEREEAINNLEKYHHATAGHAHQKLACNYLKSKSFKF